MPDIARLDGIASKADEERLAHALVSRGLVTLEEVLECIPGEESGAQAFLKRLVKAGLLTKNQARRAAKELRSPSTKGAK